MERVVEVNEYYEIAIPSSNKSDKSAPIKDQYMKKDKLVGFVDDDNKAMTSREQLQISVQLDSVDDNEDIVL